MEELPLDIREEILIRFKAKDLFRYKSVCKSWNSLISSGRFAKSHLNYTLKQKAKNNETGDTRIVLAGPRDYNCDIVGSSNGLVCVCFRTELLVVNPSIHQVIKLENPPQITNLTGLLSYPLLGFGYDSSLDDFKLIVGFRKKRNDKYRFLVLTLKSNVWRLVAGKFDYDHMFTNNGVLCNGAIHRFATARKNNLIVVSFDLSKEVFKEIPTPIPLRGHDLFSGNHNLGNMKDRLCFFRGSSRTPFQQRELWLLKNYNLHESESIWEQMLSLPPCDDSGHQTMMDYIPRRSFSGHINIWMLEKDSGAPVIVKSVRSPHGNAHIWLSTIPECNCKYDKHVFVESLVSPFGRGNDKGNCNVGRVTMAMGGDSVGKEGTETNSYKTFMSRKCRRRRRIYKS